MLSPNVIASIECVNSVEDFNAKMQMFKTSTASIEIKEEAIRELKARKSSFCLDENITDVSVLADIKAGAADIDDIGN